jgi:hypothetical protein
MPADRGTGDTVEWEAPIGPTDPELPRVVLDTRYLPPSGTVRTVAAGGNLQAAIDAAQPGDILLLEAGATFTGNFTLPAKTGSEWIVIRSAAPDASLPAAETRVTPAFSAVLPKLISPNTVSTLRAMPGAHHYRLIGIEITVVSNITQNSEIVKLGDGSSAQNSLTQVPYDIILDRVYVHGHSSLNVGRCVAFNGGATAVIDSYLADCHAKGFDSQAIAGWNGPGPFKIVNNYLEGAGENIMFGGADPSIPNLTPSDIEIRRNHFTRPTSWKGVWTVKNLFELKHAQRVLVEGNVFENTWPDAQDGFAINWKSVNQDGTAPWSVTRDVTFRRNWVRNVSGGITVAARPEANPAVRASRFKIVDNVFENVNVGMFAGHGRLFQVLQGVDNVVIEHNTAFTPNVILMFDALPQATNFTFRNNLTTRGQYGVLGSDRGEGLSALAFYADSGYKFERNVLIGPGGGAAYPADNSFPATIAAVGFVNAAAGNYRLGAGSRYKKAGSDGRDPGADIDAVDAATRDVVMP